MTPDDLRKRYLAAALRLNDCEADGYEEEAAALSGYLLALVWVEKKMGWSSERPMKESMRAAVENMNLGIDGDEKRIKPRDGEPSSN